MSWPFDEAGRAAAGQWAASATCSQQSSFGGGGHLLPRRMPDAIRESTRFEHAGILTDRRWSRFASPLDLARNRETQNANGSWNVRVRRPPTASRPSDRAQPARRQLMAGGRLCVVGLPPTLKAANADRFWGCCAWGRALVNKRRLPDEQRPAYWRRQGEKIIGWIF
jgi:hypothetical protein